MEVLYTELNERVKAATSSHSTIGKFLQYIYIYIYIYSVLMAKSHQKIR